MIFEYTDAEIDRLKDFETEYANKARKLQDEMAKYKEGSKGYNERSEKLAAITDEYFRGYDKLDAEIEKAHFDAIGKDPGKILENGKEQIPLIIENAYNNRRNYDLVIDDAGNMKPRSADPKIEMGAAIEILNTELHLHFDALCLLDDKSYYEALRDAIYKYLATSPHIYKNAQNDETPPEITTERITKTPKLKHFGIEKDKVNKIPLQVAPTVREIDGQLYMLWSINQASPDRAMVPVLFGLSCSDNANIRTSQRIEAQDDAILTTVSNLIYKLKQDGQQPPYNFTPQEIWRQKNGITDGVTQPSKKQLADTISRVDKMRLTVLYMDIRNEIKASFTTPDDDRIKKGIVEDYYLPARKCMIETEKGREAEGYSFYDLPFLYVYNVSKGHIALVDPALLDTSDTCKNDDLTVVFKYYLLREIAEMYTKDRASTRILYSTLYTSTGTEPPADRIDRARYKTDNSYNTAIKKAAKSDRDKINALLDSWTNRKWILGYTPVKSGRTYKGVDIKLNPANYENPKLN